MSTIDCPVSQAIQALQQGRPVLLTDAQQRENEADLVYVAEHIQAEHINFMAVHARGLICLSLAPDMVDHLQLPLMTTHNQTRFHTPFTVSIEAAQGISTGITAQDRAHTIRTVLKEGAVPADYVSPGHVFPLRADAKGVLGRPGHTEGSVDLVRLAGFQAAAVICEVLAENGDSARGEVLQVFAARHNIPQLSIKDIQDYRLQHEILAVQITAAALPTEAAEALEISVYQSALEEDSIIVLKHPDVDVSQPVVVRIHSECFTGDVLASLRCDCGLQLQQALQRIATEAGVLIYLRQEGRGIGLVNKLKAYQLQTNGHDTVSANLALGLPVDQRHYLAAAHVLKALGIKQVQLLTNNPQKIQDCQRCGLAVERQALTVEVNPHSRPYWLAKRDKMGHMYE